MKKRLKKGSKNDPKKEAKKDLKIDQKKGQKMTPKIGQKKVKKWQKKGYFGPPLKNPFLAILDPPKRGSQKKVDFSYFPAPSGVKKGSKW